MSGYTAGQSWGALRKCWKEQPESRWTWLAALIDGEGCLTVYLAMKNKAGSPNRAVLTITNCNLEVLQMAKEAVGQGWVQRKHPTKNGRRVWIYACGSTTLRWLLPKIAPYLIVKRPLVPLLLEFLDLMKARMGAPNSPVAERQRFQIERVMEIKQEVRRINVGI